MTQTIRSQIEEIERLVGRHPDGLTIVEITEKLIFPIQKRTLQRRLAKLIAEKRITKSREHNVFRYYPQISTKVLTLPTTKPIWQEFFCEENKKLLSFLETPSSNRSYVYYNRDFIESYEPNVSAYIPKELRKRLLRYGLRFDDELAEGTYAKQIGERLLIDLTYNSSRLEGNSYSKLDTEKLISEGVSAEGKLNRDTIMIMNHKEAILFVIENAQHIELNESTIREIHNFLSSDLLKNPYACGNLRKIPVGIGNSAYAPIDIPELLKETFQLLLSKAKSIIDPFEQSFFLLIHLAYLQAFEDVNRRTSRIACNIPFVKRNLCPLSFSGVPTQSYNAALLAVYEKNEILPMLEIFETAYIQSCKHYEVVKDSLGKIDEYRIAYRRERRAVIGTIIAEKIHIDSDALHHMIEKFCKDRKIPNPEKFKSITLEYLQSIFKGAKYGYRTTESQLQDWIALHSG